MTTEEASLRLQIDELANFIMRYVKGEPSRSEGAVDCAIRLLRDWGGELGKLNTPKAFTPHAPGWGEWFEKPKGTQ